MSETPRTWTLTEWELYQHNLNDEMAMLDQIPDGRLIEVIEKAPVYAERERMLDLLKEALGFLGWNEAEQELRERIDAFLREHGRLPKGEKN